METLQELLRMLNELTGPAIWGAFLAIFMLFAYKIVIVGSVYGVIKYCADKIAAVMMQPKHEKFTTQVDVNATLNGVTIKNCHDYLVAQIMRLRGVRSQVHGGVSEYIHQRDVDWLRDAIDAKLAADREERERRAAA